MIVNVIPLAGKGQRFVQAGYKVPKPLIDVDGKYMIMRAFESLPKSEKNIFICHQKHIDEYKIDTVLTQSVSNAFVISDDNPLGQASTTYKIKEYVDGNDSINIGACDNAMFYNHALYDELMSDDTTDFFVWTFKNYYGINYNPNQYSYCVADEKDNLLRISLKQTVSDTPSLDHCLVGAFTFKKAKYFFEGYIDLVENNDKVNGEFYIDSIPHYCLKRGLKGKVFQIDRYIGFGTPNDLESFQYWNNYFKYNS